MLFLLIKKLMKHTLTIMKQKIDCSFSSNQRGEGGMEKSSLTSIWLSGKISSMRWLKPKPEHKMSTSWGQINSKKIRLAFTCNTPNLCSFSDLECVVSEFHK
jgi:hypothetical protein